MKAWYPEALGVLGATALVLVAAPALAQGGWTVTILDSPGSTFSAAYGVSGAQQAGTVEIAGWIHASVWSGTAESRVDLNPAGAEGSYAQCISGTQQVGIANLNNGMQHASLWNGTAASWVDLSPPGSGFTPSSAYGTNGTQQVGFAEVGGFQCASLWSGAAASWVNLSPPGTNSSIAQAISGSVQVGIAYHSAVGHAGLWRGTAASWVDLNPTGAVYSRPYGVSGAQQVGIANFGPPGATVQHAGLWSGTADSWVDLNPTGGAGVTAGLAYGTSGTQQVGNVTISGVQHASLWSGTAASWEDLSLALPGGPGLWIDNTAQSIWSDGSTLYVAGYGFSFIGNRDKALLWTRRIAPTCGSADFNGDGDVGTDQDIEAFFACIAGNCCATCGSADFNGDGDVATDADIGAFFRVLGGGNC